MWTKHQYKVSPYRRSVQSLPMWTEQQYKASPVDGAAIQSLAISVERSKVSPYWWSVQSLPCSEHSWLLYTWCLYYELLWLRVLDYHILLYMQWVVNTHVASFVWAGFATEWIYNAFALWTFSKGFSYYINRVYSPTIFIVDPFSLMHFRWSSVSFSSRSMHNEVFTCHLYLPFERLC